MQHRGIMNAHKILSGKPKVLGRPRNRWKDNSEMVSQNYCVDVKWHDHNTMLWGGGYEIIVIYNWVL
jgi:hypothetical protein